MKRISHQVFDGPLSVQGFKLFGNKINSFNYFFLQTCWSPLPCKCLHALGWRNASFAKEEQYWSQLFWVPLPFVLRVAIHLRLRFPHTSPSLISPDKPDPATAHGFGQMGVLSWTQKQSVKVKDPKSAHSDCSKATEVGKGAHNVPWILYFLTSPTSNLRIRWNFNKTAWKNEQWTHSL